MNGTTPNRRRGPLTAGQIKLIRTAINLGSDRTEDLARVLKTSDRSICTEFTRIEERLDVHSRGSVIIAVFKGNLVDFSDIDEELAASTHSGE